MQNELLAELVWMSNELGNPGNDYAILGEGNTSARINDQSFWVKASGAELASASTESFVQVAFEPVLALLEKRHLSDAPNKAGSNGSQVGSTRQGNSFHRDGLACALFAVPANPICWSYPSHGDQHAHLCEGF